jgi:hypothetical protein
MLVWLIVWSVVQGPDDPVLVRTVMEAPTGIAACDEVAKKIALAGRHEGNRVLETYCTPVQPRAVRKPSLGT